MCIHGIESEDGVFKVGRQIEFSEDRETHTHQSSHLRNVYHNDCYPAIADIYIYARARVRMFAGFNDGHVLIILIELTTISTPIRGAFYCLHFSLVHQAKRCVRYCFYFAWKSAYKCLFIEFIDYDRCTCAHLLIQVFVYYQTMGPFSFKVNFSITTSNKCLFARYAMPFKLSWNACCSVQT